MASKKPHCWTLFLDRMAHLDAENYKLIMTGVQFCPYCGICAPWVNDCIGDEE